MIEDILFAVWVFLPAGVANMTAISSRHIKLLRFMNKPLDMGLMFRGKRVLGDNKTLRGLVCGVTIGTLFAFVQKIAYETGVHDVFELKYIDYDEINVFLLGFLLSLGGLTGDSVRSFFKRRVGIKPGSPWFPFDQIDFIIGSSLFSLLYVQFKVEIYLYLLVSFFLLHLSGKFIGFYLGVDDKKI